MSATSNQVNAQVETGLRSQRPAASRVPGGSFYYALDTGELFLLVRDPAGVILPQWELVSGEGGIDVKGSVVTASSAPLAAAYTVSSDKNTLTANVDGVIEAIGGVVPALNARVLLKNEVLSQNDGIYVVAQEGSGSTPWILTRADDALQGGLVSGSFVFVETGALAGTSWILTTPDPIVVGTTPQTWSQFSGVGTYTAQGPALVLAGTQFQMASLRFQPASTHTASYLILLTDTQIDYSTAGGSITLTLPAAAPRGFVVPTQDVTGSNGVNAVTFLPSGSDTIEGQSSITSGVPFASTAFESDGGTPVTWTQFVKTLDPQWKNPVLAATVAALPAYTVSANKLLLTANANGALPAIDGVTVGLGKTILLTTGAADADNGKYIVQAPGSAGTPWILRRTADTDLTGKITQGTRVFVQQGTTYAGQIFTQQTAAPVVTGTTAQVWRSPANFQVWVDSAAGNDSNPGSQSLPYQTLIRALSQVPPNPSGKCRVQLVGAGPYTMPSEFFGVTPVGPAGEPLGIFGDAYANAGGGAPITGAVTAVAGALLTTNLGGGTTADQYRGLILHNTTAGKTARYVSIATNTAAPNVVFTSISGDWAGWTGTDTFEVLQPQTQVSANVSAMGVGISWFWRVQFTGVGFDITDSTRIIFDACTASLPGGRFTMTENGWFTAYAIAENEWGFYVTDVGTQLGHVAFAFLNSNATMRFTTASKFTGYLITQRPVSFSGSGCIFTSLGFDTAVALANQSGVAIDLGGAWTTAGWQRIAMTGGSAIGASVNAQSVATITAIAFTGCGATAMKVNDNACAVVTNCTGSTGNGVGLQVLNGGIVDSSGNTTTGTSGDVVIDTQAAKTWAAAMGGNTVIRSSAGATGTRLMFAGGFLGAAGAVTFYLPIGGLPGSVAATNNSVTQIQYPILPGGLGQRLAVNVIANALATTATFTVMKNLAATGITVAFTAGVTGVISDATHNATWNDGDTIDLRVTNTAGLVAALTCVAGVQIQ